MSDRSRALRSAWGNHGLRRVLFAFGAYCLLDQASWVGIIVYAYGRGGAQEAGLVAFGLLLPAALLSPAAAVLGDRMRPERVLTAGYALQAIAALALAIALGRSASPLLVYAVAAAMLVAMSVTEPLHHALLPARTRSSEDLAAANVATGTFESLGAFAAPAMAAAVLMTSGPVALFGGLGLLMSVAALTIRAPKEGQVDTERAAEETSSKRDRLADWKSPMQATTEGIQWIRDRPGARRLVALFALTFLFIGALDVVFVALAVERLDVPEAAAGWLAAAFGFGGVLGALSSTVLIGRRRLTPALAVGGIGAGLPIAATSMIEGIGTALAVLVVSGWGASLVSLTGRMLLQGITPRDVLARVFGVFEGITTAGLALGAVGAGLAIPFFGLSASLVVIGLVLPVPVLVGARLLLLLDADRRIPEAEPLALLRSVPMFSLLPAYTIEALAVQLERRSLEPGDVLIREGEPGSTLYVIAAGQAEVSQGGARRRTCTRGECVGEIALLDGGARTATVVAGVSGLEVYALERVPFMEAMHAHARSLDRARWTARERLRSDPVVSGDRSE